MTRALEFRSSEFDSFTFAIWLNLRTRLALSVTPHSEPGRFSSSIRSKIISSIPEIFTVLGDKKFYLLYRGSRDGFGATDFHRRCDGHANTVTLISSTNDCIFGGYTPVAWSSRDDYASDPSQKSFLFTLKNRHNLGPRIFKHKHESNAIYDNQMYGPTFGTGHDIHVCCQCHSPKNSYTRLGWDYTNDSGISECQVFTGARNFTVEEIEVFEVI
jgi:hypothetical protein